MESDKKVLPGVMELIKQSWGFYKNNHKILVNLGLYLVTAYAIQTLLPVILPNTIPVAIINATIAILGIFISLFYITINISLLKAVVNIEKGIVMDVKSLLAESYKLLPAYIWVSILMMLCFFSTMPLLFIPGIILSGYFIFTHNFLIIENKRGLDALATSYYYIKNNWLKVFGRLLMISIFVTLLYLVLYIIAFIAYSLITQTTDILLFLEKVDEISKAGGVTMIVVNIILNILNYCIFVPFMTIYVYIMYKNLKLVKAEPDPETDLKKPKVWFKWLSILGPVIVIVAIILFIMYKTGGVIHTQVL